MKINEKKSMAKNSLTNEDTQMKIKMRGNKIIIASIKKESKKVSVIPRHCVRQKESLGMQASGK